MIDPNTRPTKYVLDPNSLHQKAIRAGIPYTCVYQRIRAGWDEERALTTPVRDKKAIDGSLRQRAIRAGIPYDLVQQRLRYGWPEERALTEPVNHPGKHPNCRWNNKVFDANGNATPEVYS